MTDIAAGRGNRVAVGFRFLRRVFGSHGVLPASNPCYDSTGRTMGLSETKLLPGAP